MIGVLANEEEREVASEFFELFKTPWEFYVHGRYYDAVLTTRSKLPEINSKLAIIYGSDNDDTGGRDGIITQSHFKKACVDDNGVEIPIYGNLITFKGKAHPILFIKSGGEIAGFQIAGPNRRILRVGFDLFDEIAFLLSNGQPMENAHIPALEIHISFIRHWILSAGIPLVEIPPIPAGYNFIACLTHDVDFIKISQHKFDHTLMGFVYRALISSLKGVLTRRLPLWKLLKNYKAVLSLPFIYLGFIRDFWFRFDRYIEIENGMKSTFFIIPFKKRIGEKIPPKACKRRATRYDIDDVREVVQKLHRRGFEIGVHGIDAWHNLNLARQEMERITAVTGQSEIGIRIHWLCFDETSPKVLDKAGFLYDSTIGYNKGVGYRAGTTQVFRPVGLNSLLELPLHIQDVALISPTQKASTETQAWEQCYNLFNDASEYGGVLTILWHLRSIAPERLLEDFYITLLSELKKRNAWFAPANQVVKWFRIRRSLIFESVSFLGNKLVLRLTSNAFRIDPQYIIRVHLPKDMEMISLKNGKGYVDFPYDGRNEITCFLDS